MPAALATVDWQAVKSALVRGVSVKDIALTHSVKPDTVYQRAHRNGWLVPAKARHAARRTAVQNAQAVVAKTVQDQLAPAVHDAVKQWISKAQHVAGKGISKVSDKIDNVDSARDLASVASALSTFDTVGRRALGLDIPGAGQTVNVRVNVLSAGGVSDVMVDTAPVELEPVLVEHEPD